MRTDVVVSAAEFSKAATALSTSLRALSNVGTRYRACLDGAREHAYASEAMAAALDARAACVEDACAHADAAAAAVGEVTRAYLAELVAADESFC